MTRTVKSACVMKEMGSKVGCLPDFCHHHLSTWSAHMHAHRHPLFKVKRKQVYEQSFYVEKISTM